MTARDTIPEVEFPEIEAKVAAAAIAGPLSPDAQRLLFSIAIGCFEHDRTIQELRMRLHLTDEDADTASRLYVEMIRVWSAIAAPAVRLAEALTAMMPGFGEMTMERFKPNDRLDLVRSLFEKSGIGDRVATKEKLS